MNTHTSRVCVNLSNTPTAMLGTKFSLSKKNLRFGDMTAFLKVKLQNQSKNLGLLTSISVSFPVYHSDILGTTLLMIQKTWDRTLKELN